MPSSKKFVRTRVLSLNFCFVDSRFAYIPRSSPSECSTNCLRSRFFHPCVFKSDSAGFESEIYIYKQTVPPEVFKADTYRSYMKISSLFKLYDQRLRTIQNVNSLHKRNYFTPETSQGISLILQKVNYIYTHTTTPLTLPATHHYLQTLNSPEPIYNELRNRRSKFRYSPSAFSAYLAPHQSKQGHTYTPP